MERLSPEELHVSYVTNGVHMPTWAASEWKSFYAEKFGKEYMTDQSNGEIWKRIYDVDDMEIWNMRQTLNKNLFVSSKTTSATLGSKTKVTLHASFLYSSASILMLC